MVRRTDRFASVRAVVLPDGADPCTAKVRVRQTGKPAMMVTVPRGTAGACVSLRSFSLTPKGLGHISANMNPGITLYKRRASLTQSCKEGDLAGR